MVILRAVFILCIPFVATAIGLLILIAPEIWFVQSWYGGKLRGKIPSNNSGDPFRDPLSSIHLPTGLRWHLYRLRKRLQRYFAAPIRWVAFSALLFGLAIIVFGYYYRKGDWTLLAEDFYANLAMELISIFITVIIIDQLNQRRANEQEKQRIIAQMGSQSNDFALDAVRQARYNEWLTNGSLRGAYLVDANLAGADLKYADLRDAHLDRANLSGADLREANLCNVNMSEANFRPTASHSNVKIGDVYGHLNILLGGSALGYQEANLSRAKYNYCTHWPSDFDPVVAGAVLVANPWDCP